MADPVIVEIYLMQAGKPPISVLSIPAEDIIRLAIRPLKWLRFVMFCVCGAHGDLETPIGSVVDYDSELLANDKYYYRVINNENPVFVDPNGLNGRETSERLTQRRSNFRQDIMARDGECCVVTQEDKDECQAAHIIPMKKGNDYLQLILRDRSHSYDETVSISNINDVKNGIFLSMNLHSKFSKAKVAFLKVPNFALDANDIPFRQLNPDCTILHRLVKEPLLAILAPNIGIAPPRPHVQVVFRGTGHPQPPSVILDFMYGVAAYKRWKPPGEGSAVVEAYKQRYAACLQRPRNPPQNDRNDDSSPVAADDPNDGDYEPSNKSSSGEENQDTLIEAMDDMNFLLMYLSGISPEEAAMRKIKRQEEEERLAQEASRSKVTEWMKTKSSLEMS